jgi:hypothetical protein
MASPDDALDLSYDERGDVLYASLGPTQAALSYEVMKDIWLDYVPPNRAVVGITVLNFLQHYPVAERTDLLTQARAVVQELLQTYPVVPSDERLEASPVVGASTNVPQPTVRITAEPWLQISTTVTTAAAGIFTQPLTRSFGVVSLFETPRLEVATDDEG